MNKTIVKPTLGDMLDFLSQVAKLKHWESDHFEHEQITSWVSKIDESYIIHQGMEEDKIWILENGITEDIQSHRPNGKTAQIGFNPTEQKWYGWSHRAMFGFGVGSECKKGNTHYIPSNKEDWIVSTFRFWTEDEPYYEWSKCIEGENSSGESGLWIFSKYNDKAPNKSVHGTEVKQFVRFPDGYGKGEWVAETLEDARQMACDFAESVS